MALVLISSSSPSSSNLVLNTVMTGMTVLSGCGSSILQDHFLIRMPVISEVKDLIQAQATAVCVLSASQMSRGSLRKGVGSAPGLSTSVLAIIAHASSWEGGMVLQLMQLPCQSSRPFFTISAVQADTLVLLAGSWTKTVSGALLADAQSAAACVPCCFHPFVSSKLFSAAH